MRGASRYASSTVLPFDAPYRGRMLFPLREDDSIFISLAAFRDHVLGQTLMNAYRAAASTPSGCTSARS